MECSEVAKEYDRRFWDIIFEKTQRPILWEVFRQLDDRLTRYNPLVLKLFPDPATRPRQREVLIEFLRKGKLMRLSGPSKSFIWRLFTGSSIVLRPKMRLGGFRSARFRIFGSSLRPLVQKVPTMERRELHAPLLAPVQLYP